MIGFILLTAVGGSLLWRLRLEDSVTGRSFRTVVIDPGHGGQDSGAEGFGLDEKNVALDIALRLADLLRAQGIEVVLTRDSDRFVSLGNRTRIANRAKSSIFVSIHFNHTRVRSADGIETYRAQIKSPEGPGGLVDFSRAIRSVAKIDLREDALAQAVQTELISATATKDRGVKRRNFYVIRQTTSPALLIEAGFLSNPTTVRRLKMEGYRETIAAAINRGILKYRAGWEPTPQLLASGPSE